jgi:hypothetical protein
MKSKLASALLVAVTLVACSREAPPPPAPAAVPEAAAPPPAAPGPAEVAVAPAAPAKPPAAPTLATTHGKVGDAKCRMCHKLQHDSWSASPHAAKGLDCEGCHGGGADFTRVMRDRTAAIAAGLVLPKPEFCRKCHKADWQDGMYLRVHAHKAK